MTSTHRVVEREAWSRYWNKGLLHACASSFSSSYGGAIATFWQDQLIRYCNADQQIIDFGCGNGPIAMLLCEGLQDLPRYLGIDYAELAPQWLNRLHEQQRTQIRFLSPQDFRNLPIEDNAADWLVSQFGAEYGGLQAALSEALRVLKPGGRLLWMVHHHDSIIVRRNCLIRFHAQRAHRQFADSMQTSGTLNFAKTITSVWTCSRTAAHQVMFLPSCLILVTGSVRSCKGQEPRARRRRSNAWANCQGSCLIQKSACGS
ncbi:MAG: class I SAM-dependent methyltransferase [Betaproteobacteria bacterium]|nr:class I SAM-dependent methyltransferase [Betaproteobacteria bacterium]